MNDREKHIAQKKKEILKISRLQVRLIKKAAKIATMPHKRIDTLMRRMGKVVVISMRIRALEMQKQKIIARPIPKPVPNFVHGGVLPGGHAIVGKCGRELIVTNTGNVFIPGEMVHIPTN